MTLTTANGGLPAGRAEGAIVACLKRTRPGSVPGRATNQVTYSVYRIGGAYCSPPFVQMLLMPRGTPIGVMLRSHISPKLPTALITL